MMNNITFEPLKDTDLQYACQLYEEAFPIEERRDTSEWLLLLEKLLHIVDMRIVSLYLLMVQM